jgi:hypothetical protein
MPAVRSDPDRPRPEAPRSHPLQLLVVEAHAPLREQLDRPDDGPAPRPLLKTVHGVGFRLDIDPPAELRAAGGLRSAVRPPRPPAGSS